RDVAVAGLLEAGDHAGGAEAEGCCHAHTATSLALGVRIRGRTVLTDSLARSLIRPPRWHSESAFADALSLPIRSHARSWGDSVGGQACRLGEAEHEVGDLHGLAGRALAEVVGGRDHDGAARVEIGGDLDMGS